MQFYFGCFPRRLAAKVGGVGLVVGIEYGVEFFFLVADVHRYLGLCTTELARVLRLRPER